MWERRPAFPYSLPHPYKPALFGCQPSQQSVRRLLARGRRGAWGRRTPRQQQREDWHQEGDSAPSRQRPAGIAEPPPTLTYCGLAPTGLPLPRNRCGQQRVPGRRASSAPAGARQGAPRHWLRSSSAGNAISPSLRDPADGLAPAPCWRGTRGATSPLRGSLLTGRPREEQRSRHQTEQGPGPPKGQYRHGRVANPGRANALQHPPRSSAPRPPPPRRTGSDASSASSQPYSASCCPHWLRLPSQAAPLLPGRRGHSCGPEPPPRGAASRDAGSPTPTGGDRRGTEKGMACSRAVPIAERQLAAAW